MVVAAATTMVTEAMKTALSDAFTGVANDVISIATIALPVALSIAGLFIAVRLGMKFFKSVSN